MQNLPGLDLPSPENHVLMAQPCIPEVLAGLSNSEGTWSAPGCWLGILTLSLSRPVTLDEVFNLSAKRGVHRTNFFGGEGVKGRLGLDLDTHQTFNPAQGKCSIDMDPGYLPTSQTLTPSPSLVRALKQFAILSTL